MCYCRLYVFQGCGHSTFSKPVRYCANARPGETKEPPQISKETEGEQHSHEEAGLPSPSPSVASAHPSKVDSVIGPEPVTDTDDASQSETPPPHLPQPRLISPLPPTATRQRIHAARKHRLPTDMLPCEHLTSHPLHTVKLHCMCAVCEFERDARLLSLQAGTCQVRFEPWRWQWKYKGGNGASRQRKPQVQTQMLGDGAKAFRQSIAANAVWATQVGQGWVRDWKRKDGGGVR